MLLPRFPPRHSETEKAILNGVAAFLFLKFPCLYTFVQSTFTQVGCDSHYHNYYLLGEYALAGRTYAKFSIYTHEVDLTVYYDNIGIATIPKRARVVCKQDLADPSCFEKLSEALLLTFPALGGRIDARDRSDQDAAFYNKKGVAEGQDSNLVQKRSVICDVFKDGSNYSYGGLPCFLRRESRWTITVVISMFWYAQTYPLRSRACKVSIVY